MRITTFGLPALILSAGWILACNAQQPDRRRGGPPPQWNPVHLFPPDVRESLNLSAEQEKQMEDLEKEVRGKVDKILTAQQRKVLSQARPRGPGGPGGPDGFGGPADGPGGRQGRGGQRPNGPDRADGAGDSPPPGDPDGFDPPPPHPSGPREWENAAHGLNLAGAQRKKTDEILDLLREKVHKQQMEAHADLVRQLKVVLNQEQFQKLQKSLDDAAPRPSR
jgi:Spy/CpxP family protein refolding chaperone